VICSIRPHALALGADGATPNRINARVEQVAFLGELVHVRVTAAGDVPLLVTSLPHAAARLHGGDAVTLNVAAEQVVLLGPD
jgi:hypothetical protein